MACLFLKTENISLIPDNLSPYYEIKRYLFKRDDKTQGIQKYSGVKFTKGVYTF